jgi:hypothetical protein
MLFENPSCRLYYAICPACPANCTPRVSLIVLLIGNNKALHSVHVPSISRSTLVQAEDEGFLRMNSLAALLAASIPLHPSLVYFHLQ